MKKSKEKPRESEDLGLQCPKCGCRHLPVAYTRQRDGFIRRVRICRNCGRRISTKEVL